MATVGASLGRVRVTRAVVTPTEAGYVRHMRTQAVNLTSAMQRIINAIKDATPAAVMYAVEPIMKRADELVPIDTGKLKRSAFVETRNLVNGVHVAIGYGKHGNPWYAALVHENLAFRHAKGKSAKFLEIGVNENIDKFRSRLAYYMQYESGIGGNLFG